MDKIKRKSGFSLVAIMISMMVVMAAIVAATPIITARLTQITIGQKSSTAVNLGQSRGSFICFRQDGSLKSIRAETQPNGRVVVSPITAGCVFDIPMDAESYTVTAVGAGAGGLGTTAQFNYDGRTVFTDALSFGENQTNFDIGLASLNDWAPSLRNDVATFLNTNNVNLIVSAISGTSYTNARKGGTLAPGESEVGTVYGDGAPGCCYRAGALVNNFEYISYRSGAPTEKETAQESKSAEDIGVADHDQGMITAKAIGIAPVNGFILPGRMAVPYENRYWTPDKCAQNIACCPRLTSQGCELVNVVDETDPTKVTQVCSCPNVNKCPSFNGPGGALVTGTVVPAADRAYTIGSPGARGSVAGFYRNACATNLNAANRINNIQIRLRAPVLQVYAGVLGGEAGEITTRVLPFLAKAGESRVDFADNNIAQIGVGGTGGRACAATSINDCYGSAGGDTRITLTTGTQGATLPVEITARGGRATTSAAFRTITVNKDGVITRANMQGANGGQSTLEIPGELKLIPMLTTNTALEGNNCTGGLAATFMSSASCNADNAVYPGAGGASAGVSYAISDALPYLEFGIDEAVPQPLPGVHTGGWEISGFNGMGGNGASGAIIVSW